MRFKLGDKPDEWIDRIRRELKIADVVLQEYGRELGQHIDWDNLIEINEHLSQLIKLLEEEKKQAIKYRGFYK